MVDPMFFAAGYHEDDDERCEGMRHMPQPLIEVRGLAKSFKGCQALKGISFDVHKGEVLGLLGPNGAGKSTTINILSAALAPDRGEIRFGGARVRDCLREYKGSLGIVPQDLAIYEEITAEANVRFYASLYGLCGQRLRTHAEEALAFVGLAERRHEKPKTFSGGMKRRLNIACAIAQRPQVIIMDEPTVGIDPQSRNHILEAIKRLAESGSAILYTTHYMEEVEEIASRIIIIDHGAIIAEGTNAELKARLEGGRQYTVEVEATERLQPDALYRIEGVRQVQVRENCVEIATLPGIENLDKIIVALMDQGLKIRNLTSAAASLEMVFLKLTGRTLRDQVERK